MGTTLWWAWGAEASVATWEKPRGSQGQALEPITKCRAFLATDSASIVTLGLGAGIQCTERVAFLLGERN